MSRDKASRRNGSPFGFTFIAPLVLGSVLNPINSTMLATALVPIAESLGSDIFTPPADWTELVPELDRQPSDYTVTKQQIGAFYGTALEQILRRRGVTQVVLAGVATSSGVEATARNAYDHGYNVTLVVDAMTDLSADAHRHSVEAIFPRLGETATTEDVIRSLTERTH